MLIFLVFILHPFSFNCFKPSVHKEITRKVLEETNMCKSGIDQAVTNNWGTDCDHFSDASYHFDSGELRASSQRVIDFSDEIRSSSNAGRNMLLMGNILHILQDFFAHSTYVHCLSGGKVSYSGWPKNAIKKMEKLGEKGASSLSDAGESFHPCPDSPSKVQNCDKLDSAYSYVGEMIFGTVVNFCWDAIWKGKTCEKYGIYCTRRADQMKHKGKCYHGFYKCPGINLDSKEVSENKSFYGSAFKNAMSVSRKWVEVFFPKHPIITTCSSRRTDFGALGYYVSSADVFTVQCYAGDDVFCDSSSDFPFLMYGRKPIVGEDLQLRFSINKPCNVSLHFLPDPTEEDLSLSDSRLRVGVSFKTLESVNSIEVKKFSWERGSRCRDGRMDETFSVDFKAVHNNRDVSGLTSQVLVNVDDEIIEWSDPSESSLEFAMCVDISPGKYITSTNSTIMTRVVFAVRNFCEDVLFLQIELQISLASLGTLLGSSSSQVFSPSHFDLKGHSTEFVQMTILDSSELKYIVKEGVVVNVVDQVNGKVLNQVRFHAV